MSDKHSTLTVAILIPEQGAQVCASAVQYKQMAGNAYVGAFSSRRVQRTGIPKSCCILENLNCTRAGEHEDTITHLHAAPCHNEEKMQSSSG